MMALGNGLNPDLGFVETISVEGFSSQHMINLLCVNEVLYSESPECDTAFHYSISDEVVRRDERDSQWKCSEIIFPFGKAITLRALATTPVLFFFSFLFFWWAALVIELFII